MRLLRRCLSAVWTACNRQKSMEISLSEKTELRRCLTTLDLTFIGIGGTLGSGIYVLTGEVARYKAGPGVVVSFLLAAVAALLSGICYAEFGARIPKAGSAYVYCYLTIGEFCAFAVGWNIILEYIIGASVLPRALSAYVDSIFDNAIRNNTMKLLGTPHVPGLSEYMDVFAFTITLIITVMLSLGIKNSARLNNLCIVINILTILSVISVGLFYADAKNWSNFAPFGFQGIVSGASTCFFAFIGFDIIATTCEESKNPSKSIPISILGTIIVCFLAYFGVSATITLMVHYTKLDPTAAVSQAFRQRDLRYMSYIVGVGATVGLIGATLIGMFPLPRMLYAMSQDGMIIKIFSKVNSKTKVPIVATVVSGLVTALFALVLDLNDLVEMLSIGTLMAYTIVDVCVIVLRYRKVNLAPTGMRAVSIEQESMDPETNRIEATERTMLIEEHVGSTDCCYNGINFRNTNFVVNLIAASILGTLTGIAIILSKFYHKLFEKDFAFILMLLVLVIMLFSCCFYLSKLESYTDGLSFRVPLVPWLPVFGLFFNIYLVLGLSRLTWLRFIVWMLVGLVVYFAYSMHHSAEKYTTPDPTEGYLLLELNGKNQQASDQASLNRSENSPLLKEASKID